MHQGEKNIQSENIIVPFIGLFFFFRATVDVFTKEIEASKTSLSSERKDR